jgi:hypothetical protein
MRYALIDLRGTSVVSFHDHNDTVEHLTKWGSKKITLINRTVRPIKHEDGVIEYKFSEASYSFFLPEAHPLYNSAVLFNSFNFPLNGQSQQKARNVIIDHLRQLRH